MIRLSLILALVLATGFGDGTKSARDGNRAYAEGEYERAANTYRRALQEGDGGNRAFALRHNLGASLYKLGRSEEAVEEFTAAARAADAPADKARASYNAGNAALASGDFGSAAEHFAEALRHEPDNEDARFNYEYARRRQPPESPSDQGMSNDDQSGDGDENESDEPESGEEGDEQSDEDMLPEDGSEQDSGAPQSSDRQDEDGNPGEKQESGQPSQELTREQAEQILNALQQGEERLLREIQKAPYRARNVEKDW